MGPDTLDELLDEASTEARNPAALARIGGAPVNPALRMRRTSQALQVRALGRSWERRRARESRERRV